MLCAGPSPTAAENFEAGTVQLSLPAWGALGALSGTLGSLMDAEPARAHFIPPVNLSQAFG